MTRRLIGLTGGIASGKSTVSDYLKNTYKIPVLDADVYAREAVAADSPIRSAIFARYGETVRGDEGTLDRRKLGEIVFRDPVERKWLESQIHPFVREGFAVALDRITERQVVLSIPLLFEAGLTGLVTEIWVVYCSRYQQIERLMARNNLSEEQAIARIDSQIPLEEKVVLADVVLDNSGLVDDLYRRIDRAYRRDTRTPRGNFHG